MKIKIIVATHKSYRMPADACYVPLQVGKKGKADLGYTGDDTGDNISEKNPSYCELTGLYWMWKNLDADFVGLVHYRRYLGSRNPAKRWFCHDKYDAILSGEEIKRLVKKTDVILPEKRRYYIESLYSHYAHTHYAEHLDLTREILSKTEPDYLSAYDKVMKRTSGHMFNMFIMSRQKCDAYCMWLFPILRQLEDLVDIEQYDTFQKRMFGRVSELLLNVWIEKNGYPYETVPIVNMEKSNLKKRVIAFLKAKFAGKKYSSSF